MFLGTAVNTVSDTHMAHVCTSILLATGFSWLALLCFVYPNLQMQLHYTLTNKMGPIHYHEVVRAGASYNPQKRYLVYIYEFKCFSLKVSSKILARSPMPSFTQVFSPTASQFLLNCLNNLAIVCLLNKTKAKQLDTIPGSQSSPNTPQFT